MAALAVFAVIMAAVLAVFKAGMDAYRATQNDAELARATRTAVWGDGPQRGLMTDIEQASAALSLSTSTLQLLVFTDTVTWQRNGTELQRAVSGSTRTAASYNATLRFDYYKVGTGGVLEAAAAPGEAALVAARMTFERGEKTVRADAQAALRNRP